MKPKKTVKPPADADAASTKKFELKMRSLQFFQMIDEQNPGMTLAEMARAIGITYAYLSALRRGERPTERVQIDVLRKIARFANMSPMNVAMYLCLFEPDDFLVLAEKKSVLESTFANMQRHKVWGMYIPSKSKFDDLSEEFQTLIVIMFNELQKKELERAGLTLTLVDAAVEGGVAK